MSSPTSTIVVDGKSPLPPVIVVDEEVDCFGDIVEEEEGFSVSYFGVVVPPWTEKMVMDLDEEEIETNVETSNASVAPLKMLKNTKTGSQTLFVLPELRGPFSYNRHPPGVFL